MHAYSAYHTLPEVVVTLAGEVAFTEVVTVALMYVVFESMVLVKNGGFVMASW